VKGRVCKARCSCGKGDDGDVRAFKGGVKTGSVDWSKEVAAVLVAATTKAPAALVHCNPRITGQRKFVVLS
jgi:hypothetical protein